MLSRHCPVDEHAQVVCRAGLDHEISSRAHLADPAYAMSLCGWLPWRTRGYGTPHAVQVVFFEHLLGLL
jgi:hypothetical protein